MCCVYRVCGLIVPQEDLPFNDVGICPDIVSAFTLVIVADSEPFINHGDMTSSETCVIG